MSGVLEGICAQENALSLVVVRWSAYCRDANAEKHGVSGMMQHIHIHTCKFTIRSNQTGILPDAARCPMLGTESPE